MGTVDCGSTLKLFVHTHDVSIDVVYDAECLY